MYSYIIKSIEKSDAKFNVLFVLLKDGVHVIGDSVSIQASSLANVASDGRDEHIRSVVAEKCKQFMVTEDVKVDMNALVGVEISLDAVEYKTKESIAAEAAIIKESVKEVI